MKNKIISAAAATLLAACALVSCSSESVMTYGSHSINENEFSYYLATYKGKYAQTYADFKNTPEYFSSVVTDDGQTVEDVLYSAVVHNVEMTLVCEQMFDDYGLSLSRSVEDTINSYIDDFVDEYADGSRNKFNAALGAYGVNINMLKKIYLRDEKVSALYDALYGTNGIIGITDEDRQNYLDENYVRVRHIYVNNKYMYATDEDGVQEYTDDGLRKKRELTAEELAAKQALIDALDESLAEGADFDEVYDAFSEDKYYKNGYYISENMDFIEDVTDSAMSLEVGEYKKIETDYGTHYIMRLEMDEKPWENEDNSDFFDGYDTTVGQALFADMAEEKISEVVLNEEVLGEYTMADSAINYRF